LPAEPGRIIERFEQLLVPARPEVPASRLGEARHRAEQIVVSEDILLAPNRERTAAETAERRRLD